MTLATNFQPLYKQVYELLTARLVNGDWKPSQPLPSEFALAAELGVSQGTVRKALNQMVVENLLQRRQGKGTYVAQHTQESSLFRFFRHRLPSGESLIPETELLNVETMLADEKLAQHLNISEGDELCCMTRLRSVLDDPTILETIYQPLAVFPNIDQEQEIPNSLYTLYQVKYGVSIVEVHDEIHAVALPDEYAMHLRLAPQSPTLLIERSSIGIDGRVVEWSQAYCSSQRFVYSARHR